MPRPIYQPLSRRGQGPPDAEPYEGLPEHLVRPVAEWLAGVFWDRRSYRPVFRSALFTQFELTQRASFHPHDPERGYREVLDRIWGDGELGLDLVNFTLFHLQAAISVERDAVATANALHRQLRRGGSVWEVTPWADDERTAWGFQLTRRTVGPVTEVVSALPADRARTHLARAWSKLMGRSPDPSGAYREAVRAIEAAAKPVISPKADLATLGTMIKDIDNKPAKWTFELGDVDEVRRMMKLVWKSQLDRHGTDDETVPLDVTHEQADAAVHLAITLVRYFAGGLVRPAAIPQSR